MTIHNSAPSAVSDEVFKNLIWVREELTWICRRITDEIYSDKIGRECMAMNIDNCAERIEFILVDLGVDVSTFYEPEPYEDIELEQMKPKKHGGALGRE